MIHDSLQQLIWIWSPSVNYGSLLESVTVSADNVCSQDCSKGWGKPRSAGKRCYPSYFVNAVKLVRRFHLPWSQGLISWDVSQAVLPATFMISHEAQAMNGRMFALEGKFPVF